MASNNNIGTSAAAPQSPTRFSGSAPTGKLRTGFTTTDRQAGAKASIPSRFETVLNTDNREMQGFGRGSYRFDVAENDLPGPGAYSRFELGVSSRKVATNHSKNGTASFASGRKAGFSDDVEAVASPGPGSYDSTVHKPQILHVGNSAVFSQPTTRRAIARPLSTAASPGPGSYDIGASEGRRVACSAFTSKAVRDPAPPPTVSSFISASNTFSKKDSRPSASMLSSTGRSGLPVLPPPGAKAAVPPLFAQATGYSVKAPVPSLVAESLPAASQSSRVSQRPRPAASASPMFANTILDRFGQPTVRYAAPTTTDVGPGSYDLDKPSKKALISSSWALSAVPRDVVRDRYQPPGPAFYKTGMPPRQVSHRAPQVTSWSN